MRTSRPGRFLAPNVTPIDPQNLEARDLAELHAEKHHEGARFTDVDVSGEDLTGATFTECAFDGFTAHETRLVGARFVETRFTQFIAPALKAARTTWKGVEISSSRLGVVEAYDADFTEAVIEGSKLGWLNLRGSRLQDVVFRNCRIEELDLTDANLRRVAFEDCSVDMLTLQGASAQHLDLRGLEFGGIQGLEGFRGSRVTERQAIEMLDVFATHFGIEIAAN